MTENDSQTNFEVKELIHPISESLSEDKIRPTNRQQYNIPSNQNEAQNSSNFITLGKISDEEKIEIIKLGFQLQVEGKISLKKYYESVSEVEI